MKPNEYQIDKEKFVFASNNDRLRDKELVTKPIGYFKDAFNRFKRNKGSIVAAIIIGFLVLFAIIGPLTTPYKVSFKDPTYKYALPKNELFYDLGIDFWDGCEEKAVTKQNFYYYYSMGVETGYNAVKNQEYRTEERLNLNKKKVTYYIFRYDSYNAVGMSFVNITKEDYAALQAYQDKTGIQVIYPITDKNLRPEAEQDNKDANFWYRTTFEGGKTLVDLDENGDYVNIYKAYTGDDGYTSKVRIDADKKYDYAIKNETGYQIRVNYREYFIYMHKEVLKDGITEPSFIFGATHAGQDIFVCLGSGARFSFILAIIVASVNLFVGAIYGAIEGYYGGKVDIIMERIVEILSAIPFMIVITLLKYHMEGSNHVLILFISFFLTGWIGMAGRTRMQFYRYKNQEYVLAARTLGAKDLRIMFKHIFPNALGTLITSCVLIIPGMIFSETSLSYLGIINLNSGNLTSVGTLLANAQPYLTTYPHMVVFPAIFICLLMLSFNLFGNGLRDAFNPSLRGAEE